MALNGSVSVEATPNGRDLLVFSWEAVQDQTARTSTVSWQLQLVSDEYGTISGSSVAGSPWSVTVDGEAFSGTSSVVIGPSETKVLASGQKVLTHAEDGARSFDFTFSQYFGITWVNDQKIDYVTGSGTGELDAIAAGDEPEQPDTPDQPETPEKFPIQDFMNGLVMALCGRAIRWPKREPVAYLYNGVRLPDIYKVYTPEVQKKYPFAVLTVAYNADGSIRYQSTFLQLFGPNAYYFWSNERLFFGGDSNGEAVAYKVHNCKDGVWSEGNEYDTNHSAQIYPRDLVLSSGAFRRLTWTNFDAEYEGTLYLAASEPIPVYE